MNIRASSMRIFKKLTNSIAFKLYIVLLIVIIPLAFFLFYNNFYAMNIVINQVANSNKNMITLYVNQINEGLYNADSYLTNIAASNSDFMVLKNSTDSSIRNMSQIHLFNTISSDIMIYKTVNSFFVYSEYDDEFMSASNISEREDVADQVRIYIEQQFVTNSKGDEREFRGWYLVKLQNEYYLFRIMHFDKMFIGSWVRVNDLLAPINLLNTRNTGACLFTDSKGTLTNADQMVKINKINLQQSFNKYYISGTKNKYLVIGRKSSEGDFNLVALIRDSNILQNLTYLTQTSKLLTILLLIMIPICLVLLRKTVLIPLNRIVGIMHKVQNGNLDARITPYKTSEEFIILYETFNSMMTQIKDLEISVYEEQINKQRAELKQLQLQINPHFFMNSLNIVYSLALTKNYDLIKEMTLSLISYFQYMSQVNRMFVPLKDEIEHVRNYLHIQNLRFQDCFTYAINAPEFILDTPVPPLVIQTFVENSVKHSFIAERQIKVSIKAEMYDGDNEPFIKIIICDTGKGFAPEVLDKLNSGAKLSYKKREHIGIWNIRHTLDIIYSGKAKISFENTEPSGATVIIEFPVTTPEDNKYWE